MCHIPMSDKGWLRQYLPQHTQDQLYRFIEGVGKRLDHIAKPSAEETETARRATFCEMTGAVE